MARTGTSKYGFWLAGYYEDWLGSRVIADDANAPSTDGAYDANSTHHGNLLNGEAPLNPRYRWSVRDRANNNEFSSASSYLLSNDGIARWATFDKNRLSKGVRWAGRSQLQYPNSNANANRVRFSKTDTASTDDTYMLISGSADSSTRYYIPGGDTDATNGRQVKFEWNGRNWFSGKAGRSNAVAPDFMQHAHLTGVWMGERLQMGAYDGTTGNATTHENNPEVIFIPIKSPAKKPFLAVTTYMKDDTANQLDNQTPGGQFRPVIASQASLNSKSDGDYFTIRMSIQAMMGYATGVVDENAQSQGQTQYTLKIGFPVNTTFGTTGSGGGTAAIDWTIKPHDGTGLSGIINQYHALYLAGTKVGNETDDVWFDLDFKMDYTNNKFKVYHDGTEVTATNPTAGAYSSGYTMNNNTQTSAAFKASEMTGWELFVKGVSSTYDHMVVATLIDRVALYRPLTDMPDGTSLPAPVNSFTCTMPVNGVSQAEISIFDDDTEQNLTPWFTNDDITDWRLLMFNGNIDRPLWCGIIESVVVQQHASDRTRQINIMARDSLSLLDRQITSWEIGQIGLGESDQVLSRQSEVDLLAESMFLGAARLQESQSTIGFESPTSYKELAEQRTRLNTAHPIQMYNNEDTAGPNSVENEWMGYKIKGINKESGGKTQVILAHASTGYTTSDTPDIYGTVNHNANGKTIASIDTTPFGVSGTQALEYASSDIPYVPNATGGSGVLEGDRSTFPSTGAESGFVILQFSVHPAKSDGTLLKVGDIITVSENGNSGTDPTAGFYTVMATETSGGKFYVKTNKAGSGMPVITGRSVDYTFEEGFVSDTDDTQLLYRDQHAVWMRDLPKSAWFKKHFGIYGFSFADAGTAQAAFTANSNVIQVSSSFISDSETHGVGQVVNSDGFIDTFTYNGFVSPANDGNHYLVGVKGLSIDHGSGEAVYTLSTGIDYKHVWLQWADMRNDADADADGGFRKKTFGLMRPVNQNYEVSISFTDQFNEDGSYDEFTDLKISEDLDIWELDSEVDPTTNAPWSTPFGTGATMEISNFGSGNAIKNASGGIQFKLLTSDSGVSDLAVNDKIIIFDSAHYNGVHTISGISGTSTKTITCSTTPFTSNDTYTGTGPFVRKVADENRESVLRSWESKGGSFLVYDCSKFFNLNTFINGGTFGQRSGGRRNIGDYETEYHGFPVLMDNYWAQATSTNKNNAVPYGFHENFRKWVGATAELNRSINTGDTVIETKPSTSLIADFPDDGFGKIKASRDVNGQNPSFEVFYYTYDAKLDASVVESATSATASTASPFVITCSGADFVNDGVKVGMRVRNVTAKWVAQISAVAATGITIDTSTIFAETGSTRQDVAVSDSISIPQQLYGVYLQSDAATNFTPEAAESFLEGVLMDDVLKSNGSTAQITLNAAGSTGTTGAFDEVIIVGSVSPRFALRFLMKIDGHVVSPNLGTYWLSDKSRFLWSLNLSKTWLAQSSISCWFDHGSIPLTNNMTTDGTDANFDSFGAPYDARGGKSMFSIMRESVEATGFGYSNSKRLPITYQMGRDNKLEVRPTYNLGEVVNRDILTVSSLDAQMSGHITNVRVYYNNGASFADHPAPTLDQTYRWKIVEVPEITFAEEAEAVAKEEYFKAKTKAIRVKGDVMRDLTHDDKMLDKGRYGYIADPTRHGERGITQQAVLGPAYAPILQTTNWDWSGMNGTLASGMCNAMDGNLGRQTGSDRFYRDRFGKGFIAPASSAADATVSYTEHYWWWGAHSVSHAVQVVNIPSGCPLTSDGTPNEHLRVWVALKDGQSGTDIDNAEFTIGLTDFAFATGTTPFTNHGGGQSTYAPTLAGTSSSFATVNVKRNGFYEIQIPSTYWASQPSGARITLSVNVDYLKSLLYHRCGDPSASGILHNAHDITNFGPSAWTATNSQSIFPLGARKYDTMSGLMGARNAWYCPRIHIVEDIRWRPATTVTFTDSGLGLSSESMVITNIDWRVDGRDIEKVSLTLERDQTKDKGGLAGYLFPSVARGRGQQASSGQVGGGTSRERPRRNRPPVPPGGNLHKVGEDAVDPFPLEGGKSQGIQESFTKQFASNQMASSSYGNIKARLDFLENGVSESTFGVLGQKRTPPPLNTQRAVDGLGNDTQPASATAFTSSEGMIFTGVVNPDSSDRFTQTHTMSIKVPDDVSDEILTINGMYSLGGDGTTKAVLTVNVECLETGSTDSRTITLSGNQEKRAFPILTTSLSGCSTAGNTISVSIKRTPGTGNDDSNFSSLVIHNIGVNFQRFSVKGFGTSVSGFTPYR